MTQTLADMRRDYARDGLTEAQAPVEPFALFRQWFEEAVKTEQAPVESNEIRVQKNPPQVLVESQMGGRGIRADTGQLHQLREL